MATAASQASDGGGDAGLPRLPLELILRILWDAARRSATTSEARDVCLVSRAAYRQCWPSLWRVVALRNANQLKAFSEVIYKPPHGNGEVESDEGAEKSVNVEDAERHLRRKQDALQYLYLNNNKDAAGLRGMETDEKPEMWMISILLAARNIEILHAEEYWSMSYPWESQEEKPLVAYPLMLFSRFSTAVHAAMVASPSAAWVRRMFGRDHRHAQQDEQEPAQRPLTLEESIERRAAAMTQAPRDMYNAIITLQKNEQRRRGGDYSTQLLSQPREITLSALAMSPAHLMRTSVMPAHWAAEQQLPPNNAAFARLTHLHLYFAKLDVRLLEALQELPALTHLRLTRPFSELLTDGIEAMLSHDDGQPRQRLERLVVEAGMYMDKSTVQHMRALEKSDLGRDRLVFLTNALFQTGPFRALEVDTVVVGGGSGSGTSTSRVINYVTNSEERGYRDFVNRAHQREGVWEVPYSMQPGVGTR